MELRPGDVIPIEMPKHAVMFVEELPTYRVKMGQSNDKLAVQISQEIERPHVVKTDLTFLGKDIMSELESDDDNED